MTTKINKIRVYYTDGTYEDIVESNRKYSIGDLLNNKEVFKVEQVADADTKQLLLDTDTIVSGKTLLVE